MLLGNLFLRTLETFLGNFAWEPLPGNLCKPLRTLLENLVWELGLGTCSRKCLAAKRLQFTAPAMQSRVPAGRVYRDSPSAAPATRSIRRGRSTERIERYVCQTKQPQRPCGQTRRPVTFQVPRLPCETAIAKESS